MFKNVISSVVATSILLTSFEGMAGPKINPEYQSEFKDSGNFYCCAGCKVKFFESYNELTSRGPVILNSNLVAGLQSQCYKMGRKFAEERIKRYQEDLADLEKGAVDIPSLRSIDLQSVNEDTSVETIKKFLLNEIKKDEEQYSQSLTFVATAQEAILKDPNRILRFLHSNFVAFDIYQNKRADEANRISSFLRKTVDIQSWALDIDDNINTANALFQKLLHARENTVIGGKVGILQLKSYLPFLILASQIGNDPNGNVRKVIDRCYEIIKRDYELNSYINAFQKHFEIYNIMTFNGTLFREEMCGIYSGFVSNLLADLKKNCSENDHFFKIQNEIIKREVDAYNQKKTEETHQIRNQVKQHKTEQRRLEAQEKKVAKEKSKAKSRETYVAAIKQDVATREANTLRLQQQAARAVASTSSATPPKIEIPRDMSPEGQLMHWYFESYENFNKRKEAQQKLATLFAAQQRKADAKAAKNHEIDPERAQSAASSSSSSSASSSSSSSASSSRPSSSSSSSSSTSSTSSITAPAVGTQYRAILGSHHYKILESLLTDKESGMKIETVRALFEALGGYVDDSSHNGSRVGMGLRHIDTGAATLAEVDYDGDESEEGATSASSSSSSSSSNRSSSSSSSNSRSSLSSSNSRSSSSSSNSSSSSSSSNSSSSSSSTVSTSSFANTNSSSIPSSTGSGSSSSSFSSSSSSTADVRKVIHGTHARGKNGRKGLRPEQILDIREMLINGGYTLETVISKADASTEVK